MPQYLLSAHSVEGESREDMTEGRIREVTAAVGRLEDDMRAAGTWVFGGRLHAPDTATVVEATDGSTPLITDGPFAESKEHLGGFYVIDADDLDDALAWGERVSACVGIPIEVRPFAMIRGEHDDRWHGPDARRTP